MSPHLLLIDNYDSFTYNLVQAFLVLGARVDVFRNDQITVEQALDINPTHLCISPGPGRPEDAGVSLEMIGAFVKHIAIFGVCLGHQSLVHHFGGNIVAAERLMHGKTSMVKHDGKNLFKGLPDPFEATRYHSLVLDKNTVPDGFEVTATSDDGEIMGIRHKEIFVEGVQFHPESILTTSGKDMLKNFLKMPAS